MARSASRELAKIKVEELEANLMSLVAGSNEDSEQGALSAPDHGTGPKPAGLTKTPALDQYTINLSERARKNEIDPVIGREAEVRQIVDILICRRQTARSSPARPASVKPPSSRAWPCGPPSGAFPKYDPGRVAQQGLRDH